MTVEMGDLRPAVIRNETRKYLDEYRGFRHIVRNAYAFDLRPARLNDLVGDAPKCLSNLTEDLLAFIEFLKNTA